MDVPPLLPVTSDDLKDQQKLTDGSEGRQQLGSDQQGSRSASS